MAPEIHMHVPFSSTGADLFALGVIIFVLHTGRFPFTEAKADDAHY